MNRSFFILVLVAALCGCSSGVTEVAEMERMKDVPPVVGQLPLELTPELRAAGATEIAAYSGPWIFRHDKLARLHEGDLLQVDVVGVPGLERRYIEYVNEELMWVPEGVRPVKCRRRTQDDVAKEFPGRAGIPQTPGLQIRVLGPYSTNCYIMGGEVRQYGFYVWKDGLTLSQAIATAGGLRREMPAGKIHVVRGDRQVTFSLQNVLNKATQPFLIKPFDAISVTEQVDMKFDASKFRMPSQLKNN